MENPDLTLKESRRFFYRSSGQGEPVLLLHGMGGSGRWWQRNIAALAQHFQTYAIDLLGFGKSRGAFVLEEAATHLVRWMDSAHISRAHLLGHSMGGFIALDLAADFPDRVGRLVLANPVGVPFRVGEARASLSTTLALWIRRLSLLPVLLQDAWRAGPSVISRAARELLVTDLRPKLHQVKAPTLILWGDRDHLVPRTVGQRLAAGITNSRLLVMRLAGHNCMWDEAEAFNAEVLKFLQTGRSGVNE